MLLRLLIDFWILAGFIGSIALVAMVFSYMAIMFKNMMEKLK